MTSKVVLTLKDPGFLAGVQDIQLVLDGRNEATMQFGDTKEFEISSGSHVAQLVLHAVVNRKSKELSFSIGENQKLHLEGKYSRLWGSISIGLA